MQHTRSILRPTDATAITASAAADTKGVTAPAVGAASAGIAPVAAVLVAAIGVMVLVGWAFDIAVLKCVIPGMTSMKVNTAVELVLLAVALAGLNAGRGIWKWTTRAAAVTTVLLCALTAVEYAFGANLHIDNALFVDHASVTFPGRNAPATISCFTLIATAFVLMNLRVASATAQAVLMITTAVPLATLGGYLYQAPGMYASVLYPVVALNTAVALALLCVGGLLARPEEGLMRLTTSGTGAGSLLRRLLPLAAGVPLGVGVLTLAGQHADLYGPAFGSALLVTGCVLFFGAAVFWAGSLLYATEHDRDALLVRERAARGRAEAALLARDQLLAMVSHELRTPLTPILLLAASLAEREDLPADVIEDLKVIREQVHAEAAVVNDLLDLVGLRQGQLRLHRVLLDVGHVVRSATAAVAPSLAERRVELVVDLHTSCALHASADENRIQQVLRNLLDNAAKFTPAGGRITIRCLDGTPGAVGSPPDRVVIEVQDTGAGIDPAFAERIFDAFEQVDRSTTRRYGGLGLGLTISRMLVTLHGGTLTAESKGVGRGSTFRLSLPALPAPASQEQTVPDDEPAPELPTAGQRLLLVEDHAETRDAIAPLLRKQGYDVTTAATATEALERATRGDFDLLISDIGLPDQSGWDLMRTLRARRPVRGIAVSGFTADEDRQRSLDAGFAVHLHKPVEVSRLVEAIRALAPAK